MSTPRHEDNCGFCKGEGVAAPLEPSQPEIAALRQWESDTEKPASASEGNAFMDGFQAGKNHAAAVSKNLQERAEEKLAKCHEGHVETGRQQLIRIRELEKEITALRKKP